MRPEPLAGLSSLLSSHKTSNEVIADFKTSTTDRTTNRGRTNMRPKTEGLLESSLYVTDVAGSSQFYEKIFGFRVISDFGERGCAMEAGNRQVLLLFKKGGSRTIQSPHDGDG